MGKTIKKILCTMLVVVMCLTSAPLSGFVGLEFKAKAVDYKVGDIIQFGSYPQSEVKDSATINALNKLAPSWDKWTSYGYYSGSGDYGTMEPGDWMRYTDVTYNGNKYRGVKFIQYRPDYTYESSAYTYQDNNGYNINTIYWFKFEKIVWKVVNPDNGLIVSVSIIDSQPYSNTVYYNSDASDSRYAYFNDKLYTNFASDYETSFIRKWLNEDFYITAFSANERENIDNTSLNNDGYFTACGTAGYEKLDSKETKDKIFLLSYDDSYKVERIARGSAYAEIQGLCVYNCSCNKYKEIAPWLMRSPGKDSNRSCGCILQEILLYEGPMTHAYENDSCFVGNTYYGVRPALCLKQNNSNENKPNEPIHPDNPENGDDNTENIITPDYIKKNYFLQQHIDFVTNKNNNLYSLSIDTLRFAGDIWESVEGGFGQIAAEFAYDVIEGSLEVIFLQWFDGLDCLENIYDAILLDFLASSSTTNSLKDTLENDISVICVKIINDLLKVCQSDVEWAKDMDILSEIKSLVSVSDYSENKLYKVLEKMLKGKGTGFVDGIFKTFECFGKVSDVLNVGLSAVDYFVEMMKYTAAIEAYYNSSLAYKQFLSKLADEVENVTIYGDAGEKFREAYENYALCVNYENIIENVIEHRKEKGKTFIQNLSQGILSKTTLTLATKMFGLSKAAAVKFNAALWAVDAGFAISNMLTGNDTIVNCRRLLRANHILDVASYNVMKDYELDLKKNKSYDDAELFDYSFSFYKNVQLYSLNTYKKHCETSSTKPLSFRKKYFKNELEETVGRIKIWNNIDCHIDFDTELVTAGMMGIHTAVIACPTDIYVYRKSDNKLVACVIDNVSKQYSDEVAIICVGEEKALACDSIDDYRVEIVATGNGAMDVTYNSYSDFKNVSELIFDNVQIQKNKKYELDYANKAIKSDDGLIINPRCTIGIDHNFITITKEKVPTCTEDGYTAKRKCIVCGFVQEKITLESTGHDYDDSECKKCGRVNPDNCSCNCHKGGIAGFFFKLILFFQKIFKTNKECKCGITHY